MKIRKKKKQLPVRVVETQIEQTSYQKFLWTCFVTVLFLAGNLLSFLAIFEDVKISKGIVIFAALIGMILMIVTQYYAKKLEWIKILRGLPLLLFIILSPWTCWEGMRMWINQIIIGWNSLNKGGMVLFAGESTDHAALAFSVLAAMIFGEIAWMMIEYGKIMVCLIYGIFWIFVMQIGNHFNVISAAFIFSGIFGAAMFRKTMQIRKSGLINFGVIFIACMLGVFVTSDGKLSMIRKTREGVAHNVHEIRYGKDQLPEGKLNEAYKLQKSDKEMMQVESEDKKNLYLRAYIGAFYENGVWKKMPDYVYGSENAGLIRWLKTQNFDPLRQSAQYQKLSNTKENQDRNYVKIQIKNASRYYFYTPDSFEKVIKGKVTQKVDTSVLSKGIFGQDNYEWTEISSSRPAELMVAEEWVENPKTEAQKQYSDAEGVYRKFVYDNYTKSDSKFTKEINQIFWKDYNSKSDGIYSALNQVRTKLKENYHYTKTPEQVPDGEDPIEYFLTESHTGNQMLYSSVAVEAFRAHGIPARYVEGYYVGASSMDSSKDGKVSITGQNAHAWVEVYFDGIGWKAIDVTPGYYYNVATLQKMVNTPEQVKKNAALKKNGYKGKQSAGSGNDNKNTGKRAKKAAKNIAMILLGVATLFIILAVLLFAFIEIRFFIIEKQRIRQYENADMNEKVKILSKEIFGILTILGIEAKLGWKTKETDQIITAQFETVNKGDYQRASALMEKTIYGDITLELFEERTVKMFRDKLKTAIDSSGWKEKLKVKYQYKKYCM